MYLRLTKEFYGGTDFFNYGYWFPGTRSAGAASCNLMEELLALIPHKHGSILDVACGLGATTHHLKKYYEETRTVGVNISPTQIETCRAKFPKCKFLVMDSVHLALKDQSFDAVICVEAAFHFKTREKFLREAHRVLRPGGYLVISDIAYETWIEVSSPALFIENHINSTNDYRNLLERSGFTRIVVRDVLQETWIRYASHLIQFLRGKLAHGEIKVVDFNKAMFNLRRYLIPGIKGYLIAAGQKP